MYYKDFKINNDTLRLFFQKKLLNNLQLYLYSLLLPLEHDYYWTHLKKSFLIISSYVTIW